METLVLDARYIPVARVSWQRAITLLWEGKVEVIEEYEDQRVRSVTRSAPETFIAPVARKDPSWPSEEVALS